MAIIERDVILQGKTESGQPTLDFPITRLSNIEASSDIKSKPEAGDYLPIIDGQDDGMKMVPVETLLPKEDNYVRSNKNFLRNAIFKHPVNRRGKTLYENTKFNAFGPNTIDLWGLNGNNLGTILVSTEDQCLIFSTKHMIQLYQQIKDKDIGSLLGKKVTISALIDRNISGDMWIGFCNIDKSDITYQHPNYYISKKLDISPGLQLISYTLDLPETLEHNIFYGYIQPVTVSPTDDTPITSMKLYGMKVELGDTQTLARMNSDGVWELIDDPDYAEEYAYCEKYDLDDYSFVGDYHVNENLIPNWDFRHPMNSQGKTEYGVIDGTNVNFTPLCTIDDWIIDSIGAKVTIKEGCINYKNAIINDSTGVHCFFFRKKAKYFPFKKGDLISISLLCKLNNTSSKNLCIDFYNDSIENAYNNGYQYTPVSLESNKLTLVHIIKEIPSVFNPEDTIKIGFFSDNNVAFDIDIYAIKLELGSVSTLAHLDSNGRYVIHNTNSNMVNSLSNCFDMYYGEYYPINRSNPNLLDNWYFIDPINQRGQSEYTTRDCYVFDRWKKNAGKSVKVYNGYIQIEGTSLEDYINLVQYFPNGSAYRNICLTASILYQFETDNPNNSYLFFYNDTTHLSMKNIKLTPSYDNWELASVSFDIPSDIEKFNVTINASGILKIKAMKLEIGTAQTLARKIGDNWVLNDPPPNRVLELQKCQRYLQRFYGRISSQVFYTNDKIVYPISLNCAMAKKPKLIYNDLVVEKVSGGFVEGFIFEVDPLYNYDSYSLNISIAANKSSHGLSENTTLNARAMILLSAEDI